MATSTTLGTRRNAAQLHALTDVEREVRSNDRSTRRKYLRDFVEAFRSYQGIIDEAELAAMIAPADIVLVADYHALPASQRYAATLLERRAQPGDRPVVLGMEAIFSRHQHVVDAWWRREICEEEFRQRIRFDLDWNYEWDPFYELLVTAREHAEAIYGLDCMPRGDLRGAATHDRHAAEKLAEISERHPDAVVMVLFGESHLAPGHLPQLLRQRLPEKRLLTVLQNVDTLYWSAAGELRESVMSVRVDDGVVCVFNSTPLEKYEHYRMCLDRWSGNDDDPPDLNPAVYNVLQGVVRGLGINQYSARNGTQPKFLVDLLPEVYCNPSEDHLRNLAGGAEDGWLKRLEERGCAYLPAANTLYIREFRMAYVAEEMTRFLHHACRGLPACSRRSDELVETQAALLRLTVENCLGYFGSRLLCPTRPAIHDDELAEVAPGETMTQMLDPSKLASHLNAPQRLSQQLGYKLGASLYDAYMNGRATKSWLRSVFMSKLETPGSARRVCREITRKIASSGKKPCASVR
jgi:hypothetical protein